MSGESKPLNWFIGAGVLFVVVVIGGIWYAIGQMNQTLKETKPPENRNVRVYKPRRHKVVRKIYGPIVKAKARKKVEARTEPKPKGPPKPRFRFVLRKGPPQVPPGAPTFPPLSNAKFYTLSRKAFSKWANLPIAQMGARFQPYFHYGHLDGIKVHSLSQTTFYRRMGLYKQDVITRINGRRVVAPGQARKFFQNIAARYRGITIQFRRGGKLKTVDFSLR